jgi:hypothetical protein
MHLGGDAGEALGERDDLGHLARADGQISAKNDDHESRYSAVCRLTATENWALHVDFLRRESKREIYNAEAATEFSSGFTD